MGQASIAPYPRFKAFSPGTGNPLSGGQLYTLQPGTSGLGYLKATYTDSGGLTQNTNPVILDSNGEANVWLSGFTKLVLQDAFGVQVWSVDNVSSMPSTTLTQGQWIPQNLAVTCISATQFSTPGNQTGIFPPGIRVSAVVSAGTIYGTVTACAASGTSIITTVTVTWDSTGLDGSLSSVGTGLITPPPNTLPIYPPTTIQGSQFPYTLTLANMMQTTFLIPTSAAVVNIPPAGGFAPGAWAELINMNPFQNVVALTITGGGTWWNQGLSSVALPGKTKIWTDGTYWYVSPMDVPIPQATVLSAGTATSLTSVSLASYVPPGATRIWGTLLNNGTTGNSYISPTSSSAGGGLIEVTASGAATGAPFSLPLQTPQTI
ncbi:MAG: hypothetical protein ABSC19_06040 [Syntrophorhabdales bacterium]|jgi:hypothetical protein